MAVAAVGALILAAGFGAAAPPGRTQPLQAAAETEVAITYTANCGFLVEAGDVKILVDALFRDRRVSFTDSRWKPALAAIGAKTLVPMHLLLAEGGPARAREMMRSIPVSRTRWFSSNSSKDRPSEPATRRAAPFLVGFSAFIGTSGNS